MPEVPRFSYGGQAVIEGVMIRGRSHFSLAVRRQDGTINHQSQRLSEFFTGRARRVPLVRGVVALLETLILGSRALHLSANMAMQSQDSSDAEEIPGWMLGATLAAALVFGIGFFFLLPQVIVWLLDSVIPSTLLREIIDGALRLAFLLAYIWGISLIRDVKRVFAYHGAEHMAVHAYEAGLNLDVANVRRFGTPHPRCGTAFLLTVMLVSVVVFAVFAGLSVEWRILSRVVLIPVIASLSYEIIRFSGAHQDSWIGQLLARPGLLLQRLTTRAPDDSQIEVAICAMETAMAADAGREYTLAYGQATAGPGALPGVLDEATAGQAVPAPVDEETR